MGVGVGGEGQWVLAPERARRRTRACVLPRAEAARGCLPSSATAGSAREWRRAKGCAPAGAARRARQRVLRGSGRGGAVRARLCVGGARPAAGELLRALPVRARWHGG